MASKLAPQTANLLEISQLTAFSKAKKSHEFAFSWEICQDVGGVKRVRYIGEFSKNLEFKGRGLSKIIGMTYYQKPEGSAAEDKYEEISNINFAEGIKTLRLLKNKLHEIEEFNLAEEEKEAEEGETAAAEEDRPSLKTAGLPPIVAGDAAEQSSLVADEKMNFATAVTTYSLLSTFLKSNLRFFRVQMLLFLLSSLIFLVVICVSTTVNFVTFNSSLLNDLYIFNMQIYANQRMDQSMRIDFSVLENNLMLMGLKP